MKRIIIAFFCCLIAQASFAAAPSNYYEPIKSEYANKWLSGSSTYNTSLSHDMSTGGYGNSSYHHQKGTYSNQYAIDLWAAREIYEHGALFCQVQIQGACQSNSHKYTWIDYYWRDSWKKECVKLCEQGYSGNQCQTYGEQVSCDNDYILKSMYSLIKYGDDDDEGSNRHTNDMDVLKYENEQEGKPSETQANHIILGITRKLSHGAFVTPIKINSKRQIHTTQTSQSSQASYYQECDITSVYSNGKETLLCQEGYVVNDAGTNCVQTEACKINMDKMCSGYSKSDYDETTHILKSKRTSTNCTSTGNGLQICHGFETCTYFECRDGYGLESTNSKKCIECSTDNNRGVKSNGVCDICSVGEIFNKSLKQCSSANLRQIPKSQMERHNGRECWMETSADEYRNCVLD